ncbi:hypothetical protein NDU88_010965 [Pleurodeles waltl]|uniref:Uncharacterized protein n=1 Tax=Pleurodeles waltl TaxID=8319 RepID=A0AAV7QX97_PLEWA|nr:hypothetical protein NDU88_010965 [Pleurodeles waltl]
MKLCPRRRFCIHWKLRRTRGREEAEPVFVRRLNAAGAEKPSRSLPSGPPVLGLSLGFGPRQLTANSRQLTAFLVLPLK